MNILYQIYINSALGKYEAHDLFLLFDYSRVFDSCERNFVGLLWYEHF